MSVDLTGGLAQSWEFVFGRQPEDPEMRESVNVWVWDDGDEFGFPRVAIEAIADQWETHDLQVNIAFADGRLLKVFEPGKVHDPLGADGQPRVLGAGPLSFELVEPFRHWRVRLDGTAIQTTVEAQITGTPSADELRVPVQLELDVKSAAPPWKNGTMSAEAARVLSDSTEERDLMGDLGGFRYEQLFRTTGRFRGRDQTRKVRGGGLRIRRQGIRRLTRQWGHCWQSAIFPSGRGFGYIAYPPRWDGKPTYNEGYVFDGEGALIPAGVTQAPWLQSMQPSGQDVSVVLETERGTTTIRGETALSNFSAIMDFTILQQAVVRYTWEGETANGMLERSMPPDALDEPYLAGGPQG
jgi:hypothetical protein